MLYILGLTIMYLLVSLFSLVAISFVILILWGVIFGDGGGSDDRNNDGTGIM